MRIGIHKVLKDRKTDSLSVSATTTIKEYLDWFEKFGSDNKLEEQRKTLQTRTSNMIRTRLVNDIKAGAVIPPIVIGLCTDVIAETPSDEDLLNLIGEGLKDASVIDGMQRSSAIKKAYEEEEKVGEDEIRLDFWIAGGNYAVNKLIYRMLVLNTGQVPWDVKRQLEVINKPLLKALKSTYPDTTIYTRNETSRRSDGGEYQSSAVIELYLAFSARKEDVSISDEITNSFIKLDVSDMAGTKENWDLFFRTFGLLVKIDKKLSEIPANSKGITDKYKNGSDIFKTLPSEVGFVVAVILDVKGEVGTKEPPVEIQLQRMNEIERNVDGLLTYIDKLTPEDKYDFLKLDTLEERIKGLPTRKIGQAQREFFKKAFKKMVELKFNVNDLEPLWRV